MITERILQILDFEGVTKYKFCKDLGLSNGFLDKPREITTDKYAKILKYFPNINSKWLLTGEGTMKKQQIMGEVSNNSGVSFVGENNGPIHYSEREKTTGTMEEYLSRLKERDEQVSKLINQNSKLIEQIDKLIDKLK